ncbi:hypothetical protein [Streptomyces rimosus]|uniref:hypothetical protein n=1 Tax=Streptomyces rimosus TaxID=1927 RepID=UPI0013311E45|nr:hypothetical protein [Streptomyces rimosus]
MSVPPGAEPTLWDLHRAVSQLREDLRGDLAQLAARLDHVVTENVYRADQRVIEQRIGQVEAGLSACGASTSRWSSAVRSSAGRARRRRLRSAVW